MFMSDVKSLIQDLSKTRKSIKAKRAEIEAAISQLQNELAELRNLPHSLPGIIARLDDDVAKYEEDFRHNVQQFLTTVNEFHSAAPVWREPKALSRFLSKFGTKNSEPYLPYVMVVGTWERLRQIVTEEINKLDPSLFGTMPRVEREKKIEKAKTQLEELQQALAQLKIE